MKITITIKDENLDYMRKAECPTFEMASEHLGVLERNYVARVAMELDKADVAAESLTEEV